MEMSTFPEDLKIMTTEMHTGGEAVRIVESGFPEPQGHTILQKRAWFRENADEYRKLIMLEPKGYILSIFFFKNVCFFLSPSLFLSLCFLSLLSLSLSLSQSLS